MLTDKANGIFKFLFYHHRQLTAPDFIQGQAALGIIVGVDRLTEVTVPLKGAGKNNYTRLRRTCVRLQGTFAGAYSESVPADGTP
jgi:hypothetical protein